MNKKMIWIALLGFFMIFSQGSYAGDKHPPCECGHGKFMKEEMMNKLNLTADQKAKVKAIMEKAHADKMAMKKQMMPLCEQMHALITSDNMDMAKLDSLVNQKKDLIGNKIKNKVMVRHQIYMLLNAKQKAKYNDMMVKFEKKRQEMYEHME